jgi:uncharacterized membrane protein
MKKVSAIAIASAVAGALALAAGPVLAQTKGAAGFKCYGVAKAGQNDCANAAKTHDCAGQSKADFDLGEWKAVKDAAACTTMGGVAKPGKGKNTNVKM